MDKHRKAQVARLMRLAQVAKLSGHRHDEELLCVNWNPAFGAIANSWFQTPQELSPELPEESAQLQLLPAFMPRVSALASQI